jgi:hypothetical protein
MSTTACSSFQRAIMLAEIRAGELLQEAADLQPAAVWHSGLEHVIARLLRAFRS